MNAMKTIRTSISLSAALALCSVLILTACGQSSAPTTNATSTGGFPGTSITKASADLCNLVTFAEVSQATGRAVADVQVNLVEVSNVVGCAYTTADNASIAGVQWTIFDDGSGAQFNYNFATKGQANVSGYGDRAAIDSAGSLPHLHVLKGNLVLYFSVSDITVQDANRAISIEEHLATLLLGKIN
jgi:hypothetical protein